MTALRAYLSGLNEMTFIIKTLTEKKSLIFIQTFLDDTFIYYKLTN